MSLSMSRSDGMTVVTLTSDPSSTCPPLCQLLGALFYVPSLCSRSRRLVLPRPGAQAVLGALWIMSGLLQIGLGVTLLVTRGAASYQLISTYCPVWLGVVFVVVGVSCMVTERCPRPYVLLLSILLNLFGVAMSITAIVWYCTQFTFFGFYYMCLNDYDDWTPAPSSHESVLQQRCLDMRDAAMVLVYSISVVLIVLSALGLCVGLSSAILSCKALRQGSDKLASTPLLDEDGTVEGEGK